MRLIMGLTALVVGAAVLTLPAVADDCKPAHTFKTVTAGKLTVSIYEAPPFISASGEGGMSGTDADILKKIAAEECLTLVPIAVDPAATIQYVISGKADIAAGDWYRSVARSKVLGLSTPTYLDQMGIYSKTGASTVESLIGKSVGAVSGYIWVPALQQLLGSSLKLYPNPVALAQDLDAGRIEMAVDSYSTGAYAQTKGGYPGIQIKVAEPDQRVPASLEPPQSNLPYTLGNDELGKALDDDIAAIQQSGEMANIMKSNGLDPSAANVGAPRLVN